MTDGMSEARYRETGRLIARARKAAGMSQPELSRASGLTVALISAYENGTRRVSPDKAAALAATLDLPVAELLADHPLAALGAAAHATARTAFAPISPESLALMPRDVPIYGQVAGAFLGKGAVDMEAGRLDMARRPPALSGVSEAYAVYVVGESMEPRLRAEDLLFVDPRKAPRRDDLVVVQVQEGEHAPLVAYVKAYRRIDDDHLVTWQYNPPCEITFERRFVVAVHRVLDNKDLFGV